MVLTFTYKIILFGFVCLISYLFVTHRTRSTRRYFRHINRVHAEADRLRDVQRSVSRPKRGEDYIVDLDIMSLEREIRDMYHNEGLTEIGDSRWGQFLYKLQYQRKREERGDILKKGTLKDSSPTPMENVVYYEDQRIKPKTLPVGEGNKREIIFEIVGT